eukprot:CAMPEP_0184383182 /NCGR_PEP_ID=MMETSP0007-20130409/6926_1 /TAXON_ID=97485 /ORGANISM="Prymnesium parvum, Strain Texoma1" /LENGTH=111 /DNA_ID=CAMNT_0026729545 /DNA_START=54 /DNA_END=390 /DNA_ORIENTATION=+
MDSVAPAAFMTSSVVLSAASVLEFATSLDSSFVAALATATRPATGRPRAAEKNSAASSQGMHGSFAVNAPTRAPMAASLRKVRMGNGLPGPASVAAHPPPMLHWQHQLYGG